MADSSYLKQVIEPFVAGWVSRHVGLPLEKRRVKVGHRGDGTPVHFEFDGVSVDGSIGLLVSTTLTVKPGGTRKLHVDASILLSASFTRRVMVFISEDVRLNFVNKCDGLLPLNRIEMLVCNELSAEMLAGIAQFQALAKAEVGDLGKIWKPGGQRK